MTRSAPAKTNLRKRVQNIIFSVFEEFARRRRRSQPMTRVHVASVRVTEEYVLCGQDVEIEEARKGKKTS